MSYKKVAMFGMLGVGIFMVVCALAFLLLAFVVYIRDLDSVIFLAVVVANIFCWYQAVSCFASAWRFRREASELMEEQA